MPGQDEPAQDKPVQGKALLRVLAGEAVWPPPIWLMRQAGRYLPEYRALRAQAGDFIRLCTTPDLATEITLQPIRRFGFDAAILFSDILILPWALGQDVRFVEGEGPKLAKLRTHDDLARLNSARLGDAVQPVLETIRRVRAGLPDRTALIGFAGSPFTTSCYMVEGGGSREQAEIRALLYRDPALAERLIGLVTECTIAYLSMQAQAGAEVLMLFDSWAGVLPPGLFRHYVIRPTARIVAALNELHPGLPIIGFPRLAGGLAAPYASITGVNAVGLDTGADPMLMRDLVPDGVAMQGNLDPLALVASGDAMRDATAEILASLRGRPHIFNLGHGVVPHTPPDHVAALIEMVRHG